MTLKYKNEVKYDDVNGSLEVYDNMLKITTSKDDSEINFKDIKFVTLNQVNKTELIVGLKDNTTTNLYLLNSDDEDSSHMVNYINESIVKLNKPQETTDEQKESTNDENTSQTSTNTNQLQYVLPVSIRINRQILYNYPNEVFIKQNLNGNKYNLECKGELNVLDNFISLNTIYYEFNLPYYMLKNIKLNSTHQTYDLELNVGSLVQITPLNANLKKKQEICTYIQKQIETKSLYNNNLQTYPMQNHQIQQQNQQQQFSQSYQPNYQQQAYNQMPMNQKSKLIVLILHIIIPGLGYAYMGRWGKFIITPIAMFVTLVIRNFFNQTLNYMIYRGGYEPGIPLAEYIILGLSLLMIGIWIYTLYNSITMVDKYNRGQPY